MLCAVDREFDAMRRALGANVRRLRCVKKLSQEGLAFDADIDRTYVSQIERAVINPSLFVLYKISKALDADVVELLAVSRTRER